MRTRLSLFVQIQGRIGVPIFSRDEQMHGKVNSFVALVGRPLGRSTIDPLPRIGSGRSRNSQEWNGPCEVAIIAALNKFGRLQAPKIWTSGMTALGLGCVETLCRKSRSVAVFPRSVPSTKRLIRSSRKSHENLIARIKAGDAFLHRLGHQLPHRLVAVVAAVPPKPAAPTPGLRSESLPPQCSGYEPSPTVIKSRFRAYQQS
jgi:hypothetical protein